MKNSVPVSGFNSHSKQDFKRGGLTFTKADLDPSTIS